MKREEKRVNYQTTNTYETLNELTEKTKNVWIVLHGIGYLSKYFVRYFDELNPNENYIISPQAPSKYYLKNEYKYVGASWLTKENRVLETNNVLTYLDAVYAAEVLPEHCNLILFGFSQGVSVVTRWVASRKIVCDHLVLYAGGIPKELVPQDFDFLKEHQCRVTIIVGDKDQYLTKTVMKDESVRIDTLFQGKAEVLTFKGGHEVKKELIHQII